MPRIGFRSAFSVQRSAFSFIEIMFAVIILGIGFIMIAAVFPVAIQQTSAVILAALQPSATETMPDAELARVA